MKDIIKMALLFICFTLNAQSQTQNRYPRIGDKMPEFTLNSLEGYINNKISKADLINKYYILDFWSIGCAACVSYFPKIQRLQDKYENRIQFILVGHQEKVRSTKQYYNVYKEKYDLTLASAYDSILFNRVVPGQVPNIIWVDKTGTIKAITGSSEVNESNIERFISGANFDFVDESYSAKMLREQHRTSMLATGANRSEADESEQLLASSLTVTEPQVISRKVPSIKSAVRKNPRKYQISGASISDLYKLAYLRSAIMDRSDHNSWFWPEIKTKDSLKFKEPFAIVFNYSIYRKDDMDIESLTNIMQDDLHASFGYNAKIEKKLKPYLKLVIVDTIVYKSRISNGGNYVSTWNAESSVNTFKNISIDKQLPVIIGYKLPTTQIVINETGQKDYVNLEIRANITDLESIRKGLRENGLDLVPSERNFDVLVIED